MTEFEEKLLSALASLAVEMKHQTNFLEAQTDFVREQMTWNQLWLRHQFSKDGMRVLEREEESGYFLQTALLRPAVPVAAEEKKP